MESNQVNTEMPNAFSEFVLRFAKSNDLPEQWAETLRSVFVAWINETSEAVKAELMSCLPGVGGLQREAGKDKEIL
jgi:hypothetical protein